MKIRERNDNTNSMGEEVMLQFDIEKLSQQIEAANAMIIKEQRAIETLNGTKGNLEAQLKNVVDEINDKITTVIRYQADKQKMTDAKEVILKIADSYKEEERLKHEESV